MSLFLPVKYLPGTSDQAISLKDVKVGENYAMIINNNAGLWGYNLGDTVKFVSTNPYRISGYREDQTFYFRFWGTCDRGGSGV